VFGGALFLSSPLGSSYRVEDRRTETPVARAVFRSTSATKSSISCNDGTVRSPQRRYDIWLKSSSSSRGLGRRRVRAAVS